MKRCGRSRHLRIRARRNLYLFIIHLSISSIYH
jgi:hypothetical protein